MQVNAQQAKLNNSYKNTKLKLLNLHKPCFNPDSLIICVQNSIITILLILLYCFDNVHNKYILYYGHAATAPS